MTKEQLLVELEKRGIKVEIHGCGCCGSPWVKVMIDEEVVFEEEDASMSNIK